jgi:MFS family permease
LKLRKVFGGLLPLFVVGHFCHHLLTTITVPLIPFIRSAFALDYTQSGMVVSAFTIAYGIGQIPAGWLADRIETRKLMAVGISGVALASILVGLSNTHLLMIVCLILMGLVGGGYHPSAPRLISASVKPENLGRALGFHNIGGGASHFLTPLVVVAIANAWGWRSAYIWIALPMVVFGFLFYSRLGRLTAREKAIPGHGEKEDEQMLAAAGRVRRLVIFLVLTTFTSAIITSTVPFIPLLMVDHFAMSKETAAVYLSMIYSAVFWASPLGGHLADRLGSIRMILAVCVLTGGIIFLLPPGWGLLPLLIVLGMMIYARMSASEAYIITHTPLGNRSTILGIYYFSGMEGGGVLTPVVGNLIDRLGFHWAFALAGGSVMLLTLACLPWLWEKGKMGISG